MLSHTRGIVLGSIKYKETSIIVRIFTEKYGTQAYVVNGVRSARAKGKSALYQPMTLLDLVVYYKEGKDIHRLSETKMAMVFGEIPFSPIKRAIGMFLSEFLSKVLREESPNESLFQFLYHSIELFDHLKEGINNYHLQLLLKSANHLGYGPQGDQDFLHQLLEAGMRVQPFEDERSVIQQLIEQPYGAAIPIGNSHRRELLDQIIKFYAIHMHGNLEIKSLDVLKSVLSA
ncbi:DNA replication and repair protein RecO [Roseivirga pacifica]|uniref:DNA repair protein RecO n=1 Tax=Roseivirga pacifica TaxID=1267423 RepID=A0A1I0N4Q9_9BACT|nr:DNA repair protein RecO [Roseivirga pacifica]RKQ50913.1 DNA replication and repair protein RecO [Roseivirga pacifica]SEV95793.1 DNA replication and repair protein RecO [Roseivirga pacifica]